MSLNVPAVAVLDVDPRQPADRAPHRCGRALRAAEGRGAGPRDGPRRRRRLARPTSPCSMAGSRAAATRSRSPSGATRIARAGAAPPARSGRRLVCRQRADRHAAAGECRRAGASRSRPARATAIATPGRSASTASARSASGSAGRTARRCRAWSGARAAAPILFDAFARLGGLPAALPKAPKGAIFAANNRLPLPLQRFRPGALASDIRQSGAAHHVPAERRAACRRRHARWR